MVGKTNLFTAEWKESSHGNKFQRKHLGLTDLRDGHGLGCGAFSVKPGKRAFPKHAHLANDEAIYVVSGQGQLVVGEEESSLTTGDFILLPRGAEFAHVLINDGDEDLVYLCISTMNSPEVVHYPDSDKLGVLESVAGWGSETSVSGFYRYEKAGYWDGEE
jgi:uncharacterized cupin superfamily protein